MEFAADALEKNGFVVPDRQRASELLEVVGYEVVREPAMLRYPMRKSALLQKAMRWAVSVPEPQLSVVRSLLGVWLFGAMLRRELLSVAFHLFHFVESELEWRPWWRSARQEFLVMAHLVPFMHIDVGTPASEVAFASDAQGAGELQDDNCGGYGIVAAVAPADLVTDAWRSGFAPGKSIARLDGSLGDRWKPERTAEPTIPFSRLPQAIFDLPWVTLAKGRWRWEDHITLGECRAHCHIARALASVEDAHYHRFLGLQDNGPTSASMTKGRSPSPALNFYCRKRAASLLAAEIILAAPWVQSAKQPADEASRDRPEVPGPASEHADPGFIDQEVQACVDAVHRVPC